jgi:hypothetical protein
MSDDLNPRHNLDSKLCRVITKHGFEAGRWGLHPEDGIFVLDTPLWRECHFKVVFRIFVLTNSLFWQAKLGDLGIIETSKASGIQT